MNISPQIYSYNTPYYKKTQIRPKSMPQSFTGLKSERALQSGEYALRVIVNKFSDFFQSKKAKELTRVISEIKPESNEKYLEQLESISRLYASEKCIDVNIEDKILEQIAQEGKSTIFIMNHSNQSEDPQMLGVLSTLLTQAYHQAGRRDNFPLPKIILNQDILSSMNPIKRKAFEAFGAVGVDAGLENRNSTTNARAFLPLMRDFIRNKCNIFIFPEGRLAVRKDLEAFQRFQSGIAEMINKILGIKKEVTVVPVGFSYGKGSQKALAGMEIGKPVIFTRQNDVTTTTAGSIANSEYACEGFANFFAQHAGEEHITITENGNPIPPKSITGFIKDILSENLEICTKKALEKIKAPLNESEISIY